MLNDFLGQIVQCLVAAAAIGGQVELGGVRAVKRVEFEGDGGHGRGVNSSWGDP